MNETKSKSIRMTDIEYETIKKYSKTRGLPISKCMVELINQKPSELSPEIICGILTLAKFVNIPIEYWNDEMKKLFKECVDKLCALSKW